MYKWPDKDKDEILDYSVDWSRYLDTDTILSVTWYILDESDARIEGINAAVINGLQVVSKTNTSSVSTLRLSLGTNNTRYTIVCQITTASGLQYERSIFLRIKEK